jgi:hypothetical protein
VKKEKFRVVVLLFGKCKFGGFNSETSVVFVVSLLEFEMFQEMKKSPHIYFCPC